MQEATFNMRRDGNIVFHIALNSDGSLQPIVNARIPFGRIEVLKQLLQTNRPGGKFYEVTPKQGYLFTYANDLKKPYPSVMIWKYRNINGANTIVDMEKDDLGIIPYAVDTFLKGKDEVNT